MLLAGISIMPPHPSGLRVFVCVCIYVVQWEGRQAGGLQRSIDFYIRDITPNWMSDYSLSLAPSFFYSPSLYPLHLRDTRMGPLGLWNICTITSAGSIQSFKLFSVFSLFCFAGWLRSPPPCC